MSYCVNCGVELADSEKRCPLCQVEVVNPASPWKEPALRPYSQKLEALSNRIDRRYFVSLFLLLLLIPALITLICDFLDGEAITWSAYVIGALIVLFIWIAVPFYTRIKRTSLFVLIDCVAVMLYLLFIERMNQGAWFLPYGLPIAAVVSIGTIALTIVFSSKRIPALYRISSLLFITGIVAAGIEIALKKSILRLSWSPFVIITCIILAVAAIVLERRKKLKDEIVRRLFYK